MTWAEKKAREHSKRVVAGPPGMVRDYVLDAIRAAIEEAIDCARAEARDCGCAGRIEDRIRAMATEQEGNDE